MTTLRVRSMAWLAVILMVVSLAAVITAVVLMVALAQAGHPPPIDVFNVGGIVVGAAYAIVGWLIASRRPDNAIGWIFLVIALSQTVGVFATTYSLYGLTVAATIPPLAVELSWVSAWAWAPGFVLLVTLSVLLFPDGRPPSPRWRPVVWASIVVMGLMLVPVAVATWPLRGVALLGSNDTFPGASMEAARIVQTVAVLAIPFVALASIAGMVVRFRRALPTERQQLKWFTFAAVPELAFIVSAAFITSLPPVIQVGAVLASIVVAPLLPAAAAIAILRYRLYDLDRIVSRTIAYAAITAVLAVVFTTVIIVVGGLLTEAAQGVVPSSQGRTISVALSTLVVAALFQPVRRRIQRLVDRRFDRARIDSDLTTAAFSERLSNEVDIEALTTDLRETVQAAVRPDRLGIWLREEGR